MVPLASPPSGGEMRRNFSKRTPGRSTLPDRVCQSKRKVPFIPACQLSQNALVEEAAFTINPSRLRMLLIRKLFGICLFRTGGLKCRLQAKPAIPPYSGTCPRETTLDPHFFHHKIIEISGGTIPALSGGDDAAVKGSVRQIAQEKDPEKVHQLLVALTHRTQGRTGKKPGSE